MKTKTTNIIAWILQVLLGLMFLMTGVMKTFLPIDQPAGSLLWVKDVAAGLVRFIGFAELLGGLGLILPSLLKYKTVLTPIAAIGIIVIMILASIFHITRGESNVIGMNIVLALLASYVAWARFKKAPIQDRSKKLK